MRGSQLKEWTQIVPFRKCAQFHSLGITHKAMVTNIKQCYRFSTLSSFVKISRICFMEIYEKKKTQNINKSGLA